jgi:hypothetical protein
MRSVRGRLARLVAFVLFITLTSVVVRADEAAPGGGQPVGDGEAGILLLEDGGVLVGEITRAADWYLVTRGGGQMQIAQKRVLLVCRTLGEAYEFRRQQISGEKVVDHLRLAEWCIRYDLRAEAGRELAEARRIDPDQPRLAVLERRLEKWSSRPIAKESVYLSAANSRAKPQAAGVGRQSSAPVVASELPNGVVELFTRKVQPVLVNNCSTSGCHQVGGKQAFQLDRALLRGEANRRSTMHNLEATLALVDRAHPDQSPLLTVPRKTHGGTAGPIFGPRQEQAFRHLVDWVALIEPPAIENATAVPGDLRGTKPDGDSPGMPKQDSSHSASHRHSGARTASATGDDARMTLRTPHRLQYGGGQLKSWQPRDEFDPEIFNRGQRARAHASLPATQNSAAAASTTAEPRPSSERRQSPMDSEAGPGQ